MIFLSAILAIPFIAFGIIFLMGKGDNLIAGYNTASEEERKEVNIRRLRLLMAIMMAITAGFCAILPIIGNDKNMVLAATGLLIVITIVFVIVANTWAKNK